MLIRTQNKKALVNFNRITELGIYSYFKAFKILASYGGVDDETNTFLGEYSTEEKALKVLDMIQENVIKIELAKIGGLNCFEIDWIYQMPQDISDTEEITETESEEKQSLDYYKNILFGGCNDN